MPCEGSSAGARQFLISQKLIPNNLCNVSNTPRGYVLTFRFDGYASAAPQAAPCDFAFRLSRRAGVLSFLSLCHADF